MTHLPKLTGNNWYEWKKEVETYFMLIGCGGHVKSEKPEGTKASEWEVLDQKVYAVIWFLVDANHRSPIVTTTSGKEAWAALVSEYQKDNSTNRLLLRQQFFSVTHDPAVPVSTFLEDVFSIVRKLDRSRGQRQDFNWARLFLGPGSHLNRASTNNLHHR